MLNINIEFKKGILFVRLEGILNNKNENKIENTITNVIKEGGIRYLVLNVNNLKISSKINLFSNCERFIKDNDGKMLICGSYNDINIDCYERVQDELSALRLLSVC